MKATTARVTWSLSRLRWSAFAAALGLASWTIPAAAQSPGRAAMLLPPQAVQPGEIRTIARGALNDPIDPLATTPVPRKSNTPAPSGPSWLTGSDPLLKPASNKAPASPGSTAFFGRLDSVTPDPMISKKPAAVATPSMFDRGMDKLRSAFTSEPATPKPASLPRPSTAPREIWDQTPREAMAREQILREAPSAMSPLQGTSPSGSPMLAGPPAYRWYGYGTTTPGANPYSPSGQYPRASANWYTLTGATPGAFPVPVASQDSANVGIEPPAYRTPSASRLSTVPPESVNRETVSKTSFAPAPVPATMPSPSPMPVLPTPKLTPTPTMPLIPPTPIAKAPVLTPAPLPVPTAPALMPALPPVPKSQPMVPPLLTPKLPEPRASTPAPTPKLIPASTTNAVASKSLPRIPELPKLENVLKTPLPESPPGSLPALSLTPITPVKPTTPAIEIPSWQSTPKGEAGEGWMPTDLPRVQSQRSELQPHEVQWLAPALVQSKGVIVRGQAPEERADPVSTLVHSMLRGRADGIEVRWQNDRRVMICFECPTNRDGSQLVRELSARPELAPLQVDFCVLVK